MYEFDVDDGTTAALLAAVSVVAGKFGVLHLKGGQNTGTCVVSANGCSIVALTVHAQLEGGIREKGSGVIHCENVGRVDGGERETVARRG